MGGEEDREIGLERALLYETVRFCFSASLRTIDDRLGGVLFALVIASSVPLRPHELPFAGHGYA